MRFRAKVENVVNGVIQLDGAIVMEADDLNISVNIISHVEGRGSTTYASFCGSMIDRVSQVLICSLLRLSDQLRKPLDIDTSVLFVWIKVNAVLAKNYLRLEFGFELFDSRDGTRRYLLCSVTNFSPCKIRDRQVLTAWINVDPVATGPVRQSANSCEDRRKSQSWVDRRPTYGSDIANVEL